MELKTTIKFTPRNFWKMQMHNLRAKRGDSAHKFSVPSTTQAGVTHYIYVAYKDKQLDARCSCPAGRSGIGCCHALATIHELQRDTRLLAAIIPPEEAQRAA